MLFLLTSCGFWLCRLFPWVSRVTRMAQAQETSTAVPASPWPAARCRRASSPPGCGACTDKEVRWRQYGAELQSHQSHFRAQFPPRSAAAARLPRRHPLAIGELLKNEQKWLQSTQQPLPQTADELNPRGRWHEVGSAGEQRDFVLTDGGPSTPAEVQGNSNAAGL